MLIMLGLSCLFFYFEDYVELCWMTLDGKDGTVMVWWKLWDHRQCSEVHMALIVEDAQLSARNRGCRVN
jgi:hypothetical protein